jgi:pullulanase/glycogen debranching enzyme
MWEALPVRRMLASRNRAPLRRVIEKIPYLKELGVTAVELLPVFEFDDTEAREFEGRKLTNYWG